MLPDFRFIIGAALATFMLGVTALGLVSSVKLARQAAIAPFEASHSLAFVGPAEWDRFYDPDTARRLAIMARQEEALRAVTPAQAPTGSLRGEPRSAPPPPEPQAVERRPVEAAPVETQSASIPQPGPPLQIAPVTHEPSATAALPGAPANSGAVAAAPPTETEAVQPPPKPEAAAPEVAKSDPASAASEPATSEPPTPEITKSAALPLETTEFGTANVEFPPAVESADAPKPVAQKPPVRKRIVRRRSAAKLAHARGLRPTAQAAAPATAPQQGFTQTFPQSFPQASLFPTTQPVQPVQPTQPAQQKPAQRKPAAKGTAKNRSRPSAVKATSPVAANPSP